MKKVAIIGANSYIARNVYKYLKQTKNTYKIDLYDFSETHIDGAKEYTSIKILDKNSLHKINMNVDVIFMFVGKTGSANGFEEYDLFIDINEKALLNVLNEYKFQKSKAKIIFPSTRLVYKGKSSPLKEDAEKEFKTIYAINKFAGEQYLEQYHRLYDLQYTIFRISIPYGSLIQNASSYGTIEFMLNKAKNKQNIIIYGDGHNRRTITYMGDLCQALVKGAFSKKCLNDIYNIGGENYSLHAMAELISKKYNVGVDYIKWPDIAKKIESGDTIFDDEKLQTCIGNQTKSKFVDWINDKL